MPSLLTLLLILCAAPLLVAGENVVAVTTAEELVNAVNDGAEGSTVQIAEGTYELSAPLEPKQGMTLTGAGIGKTIITHTNDWKPSTKSLPDPESKLDGLDSRAYLVRVEDKAADVTLSQMTLRGPQVHGAVFSFKSDGLTLHHLKIEETLYCGVRLFAATQCRIHHCEFVGAGGRWKRGGIPGDKGGISGGAIFCTWTKESEFDHNRFAYGREGGASRHFGIKGRGGKNIHIHHNTIGVNFAIEFPFEGDEGMEIDHNVLHGAVSIPKYAGGKKLDVGKSFDIHHNYFTTSYAIEFVRNGVEVHHNLFDFDTDKDGGNLISGFGKAPAPGPALVHNNLISNPGRGVIWINEPYDNLIVRHNHIITRTTTTPRKEGLFGLNGQSDFSTVAITDNIIECEGLSRPLLRTDASYGSTIRNNRLTNVSDTDRYENPQTDTKPGLQEPLKFRCGVEGEMQVDGWKTSSSETE